MDASGDGSFLEKSTLSPTDVTLQNNDSLNVDMDTTLIPESSGSSFAVVSNSMIESIKQDSHTSVSFEHVEQQREISENDLTAQAYSIVDDVVNSASLSLQSSGDFSLLNGNEQAASSNHDINESPDESMKNEDKLPIEISHGQVEMEKDEVIDLSETLKESKNISTGEAKSENITTPSENVQDEWLDVLGNSLLKKKILQAGLGEKFRPQRSQEVTVSIESHLEDGSILEENQTTKFIIADFDMPEAIDMCVNLMEKGEKCEVLSDVKYCQPKDGRQLNLPSEGKITYYIELIDIEDGPYNISVPVEKRLLWVDEKRLFGNELYTKNMLEEAKTAYTKCTRVLRQASNQEQTDEIRSKIESFSLKCHNNLTATLMKLDNWNEALEACLVAERIDGNNVKTLFRKGKIYSKLGLYKQSISSLKKATSLSPDDKTIQSELSKQQKRLSDQNAAQKKMYQKMILGSSSSIPKKPDNEQEKNKSWFHSGALLGGSLLALGTAILIGVYLVHK